MGTGTEIRLNPNPRRTTMSRKPTLTFALASATTIAVASLASTTADARGFGGGFGGGRVASGGRTLTPILNPGRGNPRLPRWPGHPGHNWTYHPHGHLVSRFGRWITVDDAVDDVPATPVSG